MVCTVFRPRPLPAACKLCRQRDRLRSTGVLGCSTNLRPCSTRAQPREYTDKHIVCSLRSLIDLQPLEAFLSWKVASDLWPEIVVGPGVLYVRYLRQVWEAASTPAEGILLARVIAEEGVIGAGHCTQPARFQLPVWDSSQNPDTLVP